jgi:2-iminobutanoate/2-iminopropanoate deaminase
VSNWDSRSGLIRSVYEFGEGTHAVLQRLNPADVPAPLGRYHHVVTVAAGSDLAFVSGQIGNYVDGRPVDSDAAAQTRQAFTNLGSIVRELGAVPGDIAKFTTLVVGREALEGFRAARDEVFAVWYQGEDVPANTLMIVAGLASPEILVEIEAVVALRR